MYERCRIKTISCAAGPESPRASAFAGSSRLEVAPSASLRAAGLARSRSVRVYSWARLGWVLSVGRPLGASGGGSACGVWKEQFRHLHQGDRARVVSC